MDLQKLGMDGRDYDRIPRLVSMYKTASIRRAKFLHALKEAQFNMSKLRNDFFYYMSKRSQSIERLL
jgi:hypothetical protein